MIITISREFESGGRELGKRLAYVFQIPCYDYEIIEMLAKEQGLDEQYVSRISEKKLQVNYPITIGRRFSTTPSYTAQQAVQIMVQQKKMIESFAQQGDCVIVGRCADIILKGYHPFNIFVYADKDTKLKRCLARAAEDEHLTEREILSKMRDIDKSRAKNRSYYTDAKWGEKQDYHLCINTSGKEIKSLIPAIAQYIKCWFA